MPAFQRHPSATSRAATPGLRLLDEGRHPARARRQHGPGPDVAVGRRRPGRRQPEGDEIPVAGRRLGGARRLPEPRVVGDQMIGGQHQHRGAGGPPRREHRAPSVIAASVSRPTGSSASSTSMPVSPACSAAMNRAPAPVITSGVLEPAGVGQPPQRPLERRFSAQHRDMLLGEVPARERPEPGPGPAAQDHRHQYHRELPSAPPSLPAASMPGRRCQARRAAPFRPARGRLRKHGNRRAIERACVWRGSDLYGLPSSAQGAVTP